MKGEFNQRLKPASAFDPAFLFPLDCLEESNKDPLRRSGARLKMAGYDGLVVHGRAAEPVYLWICRDEVELRPANHLTGKGAIACREALDKELAGQGLLG
jgi:hypothetical protein